MKPKKPTTIDAQRADMLKTLQTARKLWPVTKVQQVNALHAEIHAILAESDEAQLALVKLMTSPMDGLDPMKTEVAGEMKRLGPDRWRKVVDAAAKLKPIFEGGEVGMMAISAFMLETDGVDVSFMKVN
jgi:molybdopterin biosynthesis enzyme